MADALLSGWGRATWSRSDVQRPTSSRQIAAAVIADQTTTIARGLGRSYGDQATNAGGRVLDITEHANLPDPDLAGRITVYAGTSIDALLRHIVPMGWFVPVSPGTRHVTIGGAIAADIHGKNHHVHGTFCAHVESLDLVIGDGSTVACGPTERTELFWATAGGLGLTGVITEATIRLTPIATSRLLVDTSRYTDLDGLIASMVAADATAPYSVAWLDLMARGQAGRSVLTTARFAEPQELNHRDRSDPHGYDPNQRLAAPPWLPQGLLRTSTVRAFNEAWFRASPVKRLNQVQSITRFFHPLDGIDGWNRIYGRHGFLQWQMVVPDGAEQTLRRCIEGLTASDAPCFLAVLKRFGPANEGPMSFPLAGWTLAADIPAMTRGISAELDYLDKAVVDAGGRIYLAKDARLDPQLVHAMYPRIDDWRHIRAQVDPDGRFMSDLARRLAL